MLHKDSPILHGFDFLFFVGLPVVERKRPSLLDDLLKLLSFLLSLELEDLLMAASHDERADSLVVLHGGGFQLVPVLERFWIVKLRGGRRKQNGLWVVRNTPVNSANYLDHFLICFGNETNDEELVGDVGEEVDTSTRVAIDVHALDVSFL